jgi:hypothetical protein
MAGVTLLGVQNNHIVWGRLYMEPVDLEALVERGELVPCSMVSGRELGEPLPDLSEP